MPVLSSADGKIGIFPGRASALPRRALAFLLLSVFAVHAPAAVESVEIRSRLDPNAIEIDPFGIRVSGQ